MSDPRSDVDQPPAAPTLTVAAVARRLGVAPATLRTWARRYGLGPSSHTAGSHRRYTSEDLGRLVIMRRLTHEGISPAEAARLALAEPDPHPDDGSGPVLSLVPEHREGAGFADPGRAGGGRVVRLPDAAPAVRGLARAAMSLDANGMTEVLRRQIRSDGVMTTWDTLAAPVLVGLGERFAATGEGVEAEHLFSECLMGVLRATSARLTEPRNTAPVLLACLDEEQHSLPLHAVAAALSERGVGVRQLGMRVPASALASAVRRSGPAVVLLYAAMPVVSVEVLRDLTRVRPSPRVLVGGPGWPADLPPSISRMAGITQAVDAILDAVL
ncbi:MAG TPA: cobalamin B12-binding domain-containing protein [Actinomycetales bacterium]|nr:cobalamin B12-binding domain-containing protein [Actinomycetales bacterium]